MLIMGMNADDFEDLFVLELANNHWGKLDRGLKIIDDYGAVVKANGMHAAIKLQIRDVDNFIHKDFVKRDDIRYIKKTIATKMSFENYAKMVQRIKDVGCIPMATAFDEESVDMCLKLGIGLLKIASSDLDDWVLIEKLGQAGVPVSVSTGGSNVKQIDEIVEFFDKKNIPLIINHCVSLYPTKAEDLNLNQIDFLKNRYPGHVIGLSTHEYNDNLASSMYIAYAKGARSVERHIDIDYEGVPVSPYCSLPEDVDAMFKAYKMAKVKCGGPGTSKCVPPESEIRYLDALVRGVYAKRDLKAGETLTKENTYLAIPLQKGQISCREIKYDEILKADVKADALVAAKSLDSKHIDADLMKIIEDRGL